MSLTIRTAKERTINLTVGLTEIATACAVITCGGDAVEDEYEAPPPALMSISDIEAMFTVPAHAPYKDEETAEYERTINDKDDEIEALEDELNDLQKEVKTYEDENKALRSEISVPSISEDNDKGREVVDSKTSSREKKPLVRTQGQTFEATAYTAKCDGCTGVTATGDDVRNTITTSEGLRIVAAPASIPFNTKMKITQADGTSFTAVVLDRGGAITEGRLDVLVPDKATAKSFGRQDVKVEVLN